MQNKNQKCRNSPKLPKTAKTEKVQNLKLTSGHLPLCLPTKKYIKPPQKNDESGPKRQKQPKTAPKHQNANFSKFPRCPIFKFFVVTREVICQKMAPILDPVNFFWVFSLLGHCVYMYHTHQSTLGGREETAADKRCPSYLQPTQCFHNGDKECSFFVIAFHHHDIKGIKM